VNPPLLTTLEILHCEMGSITSRADHSVAFKVITPELRPSEAGALMQLHGRSCCVTVKPHDGSEAEPLKVTTERDRKTQAQRLRAVLFLLWKQQGEQGLAEHFYETRMEQIIESIKANLT